MVRSFCEFVRASSEKPRLRKMPFRPRSCCWRKASRLAGTGSVAGFLHAVAFRTARDARRAEDRRRRRELAHGAPRSVPADDLTWREVRGHLDAELLALPEKYRLPLLLCYLQELNYEAAARQLGCSVGALRGRLERGKEMLRKRLARLGLPLAAPVLVLGKPAAVSAVLVEATRATVRAGLTGGAVPSTVARLLGSAARLKAMLVTSAVAVVATISLVLAGGSGPGDPPPPAAKPPVARTDAARPRTDSLGDPLPADALLRLGTSRFRHGREIYSLAYSADGRRIVTGNAGLTRLLDSASVIVWDADTGKPLRRWDGHAHVVRSVAISGDNKYVAVANGFGKVVLYDLAADKMCREFDSMSPERVLFTPDSSTLLIANGPQVRRWDLARERELEPFRGHVDSIFGLTVTPDGKTLATCACDGTVRLWDSAGKDHTVLLWDLGGRSPKGSLTAQDRDTLWTTLAGNDPAAAYSTIRTLAAVPEQALPLLKERLKPVTPVETKRLQSLLDELDRDQFEVRQRASDELEKSGFACVPFLRKALKEKERSAEVRRRVEDLLDRLNGAYLSPAELRAVRAIEVLERIGSTEARRVLYQVARGIPGCPLRTSDAQAASRRLQRRPQQP